MEIAAVDEISSPLRLDGRFRCARHQVDGRSLSDSSDRLEPLKSGCTMIADVHG